MARMTEAGLKDVVDRIVKKVRDNGTAQRMVERVTRFFHTQNPADDLTPQEVRSLYHDEDYGDDFDVKGDKELDIGWTDHAEYRSELRDVDPSRVNEAVRDFVDVHPGMRDHKKVKLVKPGVGKAVVDLDTMSEPEEAAVVTVMASDGKTAAHFHPEHARRGITKVNFYDFEHDPELVEELVGYGYKSFDLEEGPYFHDPDVWMVPRKDLAGTYRMNHNDVRRATIHAHYRIKELFELSRKDLDGEDLSDEDWEIYNKGRKVASDEGREAMNRLDKIASKVAAEFDLPRGAKPGTVVAFKKGYYTNSGLDMGQYEETRYLNVAICLEDGSLVGWYDYRSRKALKPSGPDESVSGKIFGPLGGVSPHTIEGWTSNLFRNSMIDEPRAWAGPSMGRGTFRLEQLLELAQKGSLDDLKSITSNLSVDEKIVLVSFMYKPSYGGIKETRRYEAMRQTGITEADYNAAREDLKRKGFINPAHALTALGKEAREQLPHDLREFRK